MIRIARQILSTSLGKIVTLLAGLTLLFGSLNDVIDFGGRVDGWFGAESSGSSEWMTPAMTDRLLRRSET